MSGMEECPDRDLVARSREGDRSAFDQLIDRYQAVVFGVVKRMVREPEDARDITQTAFLKAYEKLDTFRINMRFFSWLYRIAINETINFLESRKQQSQLNPDTGASERTPDIEFDRAQLIRTVDLALAQLNPRTRALVVLRHYADLSYRDLGFIFDTPERTIKSRLYGARRILARQLRRRGITREDLGQAAD